jgi:hypothetical protein
MFQWFRLHLRCVISVSYLCCIASFKFKHFYNHLRWKCNVEIQYGWQQSRYRVWLQDPQMAVLFGDEVSEKRK